MIPQRINLKTYIILLKIESLIRSEKEDFSRTYIINANCLCCYSLVYCEPLQPNVKPFISNACN